VTSWAVVDGNGRRKPAWYALRRAYAPRLLTVQPRAADLVAVLVNDTAEGWEATLEVSRLSFVGDVRARVSLDACCPAYGVTTVVLPRDVWTPEKPTFELLCVTAQGHRALWWYALDKELRLPATSFHATTRARSGGYDVQLRAQVLLRDVCVLVDRLDAGGAVDEMLVTLLPGESATFRVDVRELIDGSALAAPPVLRCVNDVVAANR
jgi:beta-mannosidase